MTSGPDTTCPGALRCPSDDDDGHRRNSNRCHANQRRTQERRRRRGGHLILPLPQFCLSLLSSALRLNYHAVSIFPMENKRSLALPLNLAFIARTKNAFGSQICEFTAIGLLSKINGGAALAVQRTRATAKANCMQDGCTEGTTIRARFRGSNYNFLVK